MEHQSFCLIMATDKMEGLSIEVGFHVTGHRLKTIMQQRWALEVISVMEVIIAIAVFPCAL